MTKLWRGAVDWLADAGGLIVLLLIFTMMGVAVWSYGVGA